jgi:AAA domain
MATLMMHRNLLKQFGKLPVRVQKRMADFIERFQSNPADPALHLHPLRETMVDPKVRGADLPDGYRAIIIAPERGDTYLLVHIDTHDEAYAWARNKRFEVHEMTGVFQIFNAAEVNAAVGDPRRDDRAAHDYILVRLSDDELYRAGVPRPLIPAVRGIRSDIELEALAAYLPPDCRDVLYGIAAGMDLDEALEEMLGLAAATVEEPAPETPGDFTHIQRAPNFDLVLVEGEAALKQILEGTLEEWRIFLHPYQRKLVTWETRGPMSITGAAGTGKTVALMHRSVELARRSKDPNAHTLVTTFTTTLSIDIKQRLRRLGPDVVERIEVTHLHALARTICARSGWRGRIATDDDLTDIWDEVWQDHTLGLLPMPREALQEEYAWVVDPNGIADEEAYLTAVRSGRPRITREQRRQVWAIYRMFQRGLHKRNLLTFDGAIHQARLAVEHGNFQPYTHVLVDEVQDFSLEALRLMRALSPTADAARDPLCLVGDGHQRIYHTKIPLSRAGIDVRGRSRRLKVNYRTSEQIRQYAQRMLQGLDIDDLAGGTASIAGDHSIFKGPQPLIIRCRDAHAEAHAVVDWVRDLIERRDLKPHEVCVTPYKPVIVQRLNTAGIQTHELKDREDPGEKVPGVRLGSMKRIKGLEFRVVAMACADQHDVHDQHPEIGALSRCERYVAATRAREYLLVTLPEA